MRDPIRTAFAALAFLLGLISAEALTCSQAMAAPPAKAQPTETTGPIVAAHRPETSPDAAETAEPTPRLVTLFARWSVASGDNHNLPFVIIDKVGAEVFVFTADGQLWGKTPALLGLARGDDSEPGIGERKLSTIRPEERTTPAGRFQASYGPALGDHKVLWVDYGTAISLHPVVVTNRKEQRVKRLKSPTPDDNRITFGCINVPAGFYEDVVRPAFTGITGIVYILPETKPLEEVFPGLPAQVIASAVPAKDFAKDASATAAETAAAETPADSSETAAQTTVRAAASDGGEPEGAQHAPPQHTGEVRVSGVDGPAGSQPAELHPYPY